MSARSLVASDDYRHTLSAGEHEAFYFVFLSPDRPFFGFLRLLFSADRVLEMVVLRRDRETWFSQREAPCPPALSPVSPIAGPGLHLVCEEPWQTWHGHWQGPLQREGNHTTQSFELDLTFQATTPPLLYRFGPYTQVQQDGHLEGRVEGAGAGWQGTLIGYRDRSWGQRPMGAASGWTVACLPGRFYAVVAETAPRPVRWGQCILADGRAQPLTALTLTVGEAEWRLEDPVAGLGPWQARRREPPLVVHLGPAGREAVRDAPQPDDLYRDELGPALFISPQGETEVGFVEQARRLP